MLHAVAFSAVLVAVTGFTHLSPSPARALLPPDSVAFAQARTYAAATGAQAVLVMYRGKIIHEAYMAGGGPTTKQLLASGSKSLVGLATIAAAADGLLSLDEPVSSYLSEWQGNGRKSAITIRQLLSLESGLETGDPGTGCGGARATWADAINAKTFASPGTHFRYGPYPFSVMASVLERVTDGMSFEGFLNERLLKPLGITVAWPVRCADGNPRVAGGASMTARDWALLGEMVRLGGLSARDHKRVLPDSLIRQLFIPAEHNRDYGMSWWLAGATVASNPTIEHITSTALPSWMPADLVMAAGMGKQRLYVIPSRELVIVRLGPIARGAAFKDVVFLKPLLSGSAG